MTRQYLLNFLPSRHLTCATALCFGVLLSAAIRRYWLPPEPPKLVGPASPVSTNESRISGLLVGTITLRNDGAQLMRIHKLESGCACAQLGISQSEIEPGREAVVDVQVRYKELGQLLMVPVRVYSNDPATPRAEFFEIGRASCRERG